MLGLRSGLSCKAWSPLCGGLFTCPEGSAALLCAQPRMQAPVPWTRGGGLGWVGLGIYRRAVTGSWVAALRIVEHEIWGNLSNRTPAVRPGPSGGVALPPPQALDMCPLLHHFFFFCGIFIGIMSIYFQHCLSKDVSYFLI